MKIANILNVHVMKCNEINLENNTNEENHILFSIFGLVHVVYLNLSLIK